jgi:outer membrane biosynthesis protein TonB
MEYAKIIAITGLPGLYELITSKSDGGIVRSLEDKSTRFVSSRIHQFSHLESIEVYTTRHNENLVTVLKAMEASSEKLPDEKDPVSLKAYFEKVYPELDHSRVYTSDLKKMVKWFAVLRANEVEIKLSEPAPEEAEEVETPEPAKKPAKEKAEEKTAEPKKPAKKPEGKKAEIKKPEEPKQAKKAAAAKEEKPAKSAKKEPEKKAASPKTKDAQKSSAQNKSKKPAAKKKSK